MTVKTTWPTCLPQIRIEMRVHALGSTNDVWTTIGLAQQTNLNPNITVQMITGAGHHFDLNSADSSDSAEVISARNEFLTLARSWLGAN